MSKYLLAGPDISEEDIEAVTNAARTNWYSNANISIQDFETAFASYVGRKFAIATPCCTAAIHLALLTKGIGPGDEVIVPQSTWIATSAPISYVNATPVFVDVNINSWCIDASTIVKGITSNTKAIIAVNLYGNMADWDGILELAKLKDFFVVEDAAESIGAKYKNQLSGSFGDVSVFSFHGSKTLTTGEGGMLVTDDEDFYKQALILRDHGRKPGDTEYLNEIIAYKYKMSSFQAAMGLSQLKRIDQLIDKKREIFNWYEENLKEVPCANLGFKDENVYASYWLITVVFDEDSKYCSSEVRSKLKEKGVDTRPFFYPLSTIPAYRPLIASGYAREQPFPNSKFLSEKGLNLPSALNLTETDVFEICNILKDVLNQI